MMPKRRRISLLIPLPPAASTSAGSRSTATPCVPSATSSVRSFYPSPPINRWIVSCPISSASVGVEARASAATRTDELSHAIVPTGRTGHRRPHPLSPHQDAIRASASPFSSLMFLRPEPPRLTRKSRLEDILLLLARCALLALLAIAFARPFFKELVSPDQDPNANQRTVLLIDVSASMQRSGLWDKAMAKAETVIEKTKSDGSLAILAFGDETKALLRFDQWNEPARGKSTGRRSGNLGQAQTRLGWHALGQRHPDGVRIAR